MEERRRARVAAVGGLTLLVGGTAVAAVADGSHSASSSVALGLLTLALGHALLDEIRRQARRRSTHRWTGHDTANASVLGAGALAAFTTTLVPGAPVPLRIAAGALSLGYVLSCGYFVVLRRRTVRAAAPARPAATAAEGPS